MNNLTCIIVDDEELARKLLETYVEKLPSLSLLKSYKNPELAIEFLKENPVDLVLLDIQMPELSGLEFVKQMDNIKPHIIFTTAYSDFALDGFALDVTDYLLKPFSFERFSAAIKKVEEVVELERKANLFTKEEDEVAKEILLVKSEHKIHRLLIKDIDYIQSMREYVAYYRSGKRLLSLNSLKHLEEQLAPNGFIRIHKSYLVDSGKVQMLEGNALHINGEKLPIGASYKEKVVKLLFQ
jgi:DNA-binding LytR/AlgR family response regulator